MSYAPDLSGLNPDYFVSTYQRTIFRYAQKIVFDSSVFKNANLSVIKMGTLPSVLTYGVDYTAYDDDLDIDAMSVCMNIDPSFSGTLLKSITMLITPATPFKIQVKFNQLMMGDLECAVINEAREIEVTPALISNMVEQINYLQQMVLDNGDQYSPQSGIVKLALVEDPNGTNVDNVIVDEPHDINTLNNHCMIRPIYGSFFRDSVSIKNSVSGVPFVVNTDYVVLDLDIIRTQVTSNVSGVYRAIKILKATVGELKVAYRAYGGEADVASMRSVQEQVNVIEQYLAHTSYITPKTLPADPTVIGIRNKLQEIEGNMRLLLQNGLPTYADCSTGTAVLKRVVSQDTVLHWWSIATMYRVAGSTDDVLADVFKFRLTSLISGLMFECSVDVNVNSSSSERISVACNNSNVPERTLELYSPKLRIIQVNTGGVYSGVVLQLGMQLSTGILQETFDIEDMSGRESCWKLVPFSATATPPEDTGVLMPNNTFTYSAGDQTAVANEVTIPFREGLNILIPSANIPMILGTMNQAGSTENFDTVVQNLGNIDIDKATAFSLKITAVIGTPFSRTLVFIIPISSKDRSNKYWGGSNTMKTIDGTYVISVALWYSVSDTSWKIGYYTNATNQSVPLNIVGTKLVF